ncbi:MAG: 50S ribosomal protein L17 [Saprospiraceae bacterium]|nr:50S ribosomal protein L17 [Saprospiraceae bacterium]
MRHGVKTNNLGRKIGHRVALFKNLSIALIMHKRINTTLAKAKNLRVQLEPLVTKSKDNTQHSRRTVFSYLQNNDSVSELFDTIGPKVADRPGGYLRIIKTGFRKGDGAETALIEFVDFNEVYSSKPASATGKKKVRRGRAKATAAAPATENESASAEETAAEETAE